MDFLENKDLEHLNNLLKDSPLPWWEWDVQNNIVISNGLKEEMLGYDPENFQDVGFEAYTELLHPDDYERAMQAMRDCLEGKEPIYQVDYRIKKADGNYTWYMDRGRVLRRNSQGKPILFRGLVIDLGEDFDRSQKDLKEFETIRETLPKNIHENITICSVCRKYKVEKNKWIKISKDMLDVFEKDISHSLCPTCLKKLYPDCADKVLNNEN